MIFVRWSNQLLSENNDRNILSILNYLSAVHILFYLSAVIYCLLIQLKETGNYQINW